MQALDVVDQERGVLAAVGAAREALTDRGEGVPRGVCVVGVEVGGCGAVELREHAGGGEERDACEGFALDDDRVEAAGLGERRRLVGEARASQAGRAAHDGADAIGTDGAGEGALERRKLGATACERRRGNGCRAHSALPPVLILGNVTGVRSMPDARGRVNDRECALRIRPGANYVEHVVPSDRDADTVQALNRLRSRGRFRRG
ncbi:MAG: hypothetical protein FJZ92_07600 [Chloroflexi bacterium]|nr:hypothetical protein [Chloroflexota bacterium]